MAQPQPQAFLYCTTCRSFIEYPQVQCGNCKNGFVSRLACLNCHKTVASGDTHCRTCHRAPAVAQTPQVVAGELVRYEPPSYHRDNTTLPQGVPVVPEYGGTPTPPFVQPLPVPPGFGGAPLPPIHIHLNMPPAPAAAPPLPPPPEPRDIAPYRSEPDFTGLQRFSSEAVVQRSRFGPSTEMFPNEGDTVIMNEMGEEIIRLHHLAQRMTKFAGHMESTRACIRECRNLATSLQEEIEVRRGSGR